MAAYLNLGTVRETKDYKPRTTTRDCDYKTLYRFEKENILWLADHFLGEKLETRGGALSSEQKMKVFLRYMGDPGFQAGVGEDVGIDQTTVSRTIHEVRVKIMGIDCTLIRIPKPKADGDEFINRKNYPSLNVQATCDAKERFTSISAEWPGSVHDSRILRNSDIPRIMNNFPGSIILGDSGYGISPWLITPYKNPNTNTEIHFNKIYASERVIIERCFGQLKRRFPILHYKVRTALRTVPSIITCCAVLHNIAKYLQDDDDFPELHDDGLEPEDDDEPSQHTAVRTRQLGQQKRDQIADALYQNRN